MADHASTTIQRGALSGEGFRNIAAKVEDLAGEDTALVQPFEVGYKTAVAAHFSKTLAVYVANRDSMPKLSTILASPLRRDLTKWVTFGVGLELFQVHGVHEMVLTRSSHFFKHMISRWVRVYTTVIGEDIPPRYFDVSLQDALARIQPRNQANLTALFWPVKGLPCSTAPADDRMRSPDILRQITDVQYRTIYDRLLTQDLLNHHFMTRKEFQKPIKTHLPAIRCILPHVLRCLIFNFDKDEGRGRSTQKRDVNTILRCDYIEPLNYRNPQTVNTHVHRF